MSFYVNYNGQVVDAAQPVATAGNRSLRYGDGCFETMRMHNGNIALWQLHAERLLRSLQTLQINTPHYFTEGYLYNTILSLAKENGHNTAARIRLNAWRSEHNNQLEYVIETAPLTAFSEKGLIIDVYPDAQKSCDMFANIKSNNYLIYTMAGLWAKQKNVDEAIVLNTYGRVADATIANVFIVKNGVTITPSLSEGCVAGVMRRQLIDEYAAKGNRITEAAITLHDLYNADEIFLTNAVKGKIKVQWQNKP